MPVAAVQKDHSNTHTYLHCRKENKIITLKLLHERSCDADRQLVISIAELIVCVSPKV